MANWHNWVIKVPVLPTVRSNWLTAALFVNPSKGCATTEGAAKNNNNNVGTFSIQYTRTHTIYTHIHTLSDRVDEAFLCFDWVCCDRHGDNLQQSVANDNIAWCKMAEMGRLKAEGCGGGALKLTMRIAKWLALNKVVAAPWFDTWMQPCMYFVCMCVCDCALNILGQFVYA